MGWAPHFCQQSRDAWDLASIWYTMSKPDNIMSGLELPYKLPLYEDGMSHFYDVIFCLDDKKITR